MISKVKAANVSISRINIDGRAGIGIGWSFQIFFNKEEGGKFSCYIPGFDIWFTTSEKEKIEHTAVRLTSTFFDYHMEIIEKDHLKSLALALNKLGFKAVKNPLLTLQDMVHNKLSKNSKFKGGSKVDEAAFEDFISIEERSMVKMDEAA